MAWKRSTINELIADNATGCSPSLQHVERLVNEIQNGARRNAKWDIGHEVKFFFATKAVAHHSATCFDTPVDSSSWLI